MGLRPLDLKSFNPLRPAAGAAENWYSFRRDVIFIGTVGEHAPRAVAHEADHYLLHISTPYGLFLQQLADLQREKIVQYCHTLSRATNRVYYPIYEFAHSWPHLPCADGVSAGAKKRQADAIQTFVEPWLDAMFLELVLEGVNEPSIVNATEAEAIDVFHSFETQLMDKFPDDLLFLAREPNRKAERIRPFIDSLPQSERIPEILSAITGKACPTNSVTGGVSVPFGGASMFEGHAFVAQKGYDERTVRTIFYSDPTLQYATAILATAYWYGIDKKSDRDIQRLFSTMSALTDLSLFSPIGPVYSRLRPPTATWHDIHPGFRFLHAISKTAELDMWLDDLDQTNYRAFQDGISAALGWPKPDEFVEIGCLVSHKDFARHRQACVTRQEYPCLNIEEGRPGDPFTTAIGELIEFEAPMLFLPAKGHNMLMTNRKSTLDQVVRFFLETLVWKVMSARRMRVRDCLPELDYQAEFSNIQTADDFWEKMISGSTPFLREDQFVPLH